MGSVGTNIKLRGGENDPEITDSIEDYYLPDAIRTKLPIIRGINTYEDFEKYLNDKGISLDTDLDKLKVDRRKDIIPTVQEMIQKVATAIETYEYMFGKNSLSSLKAIKLYDQDLDTHAAYHFNLKGENDPLAGTIRFRDWNVSGRDIFHELGHVMQDSMKGHNDDIISYTNNLARNITIPNSAYKGVSNLGEQNAEMMAEALAFGFSRGTPQGLRFITAYRNYIRKKR